MNKALNVTQTLAILHEDPTFEMKNNMELNQDSKIWMDLNPIDVKITEPWYN